MGEFVQADINADGSMNGHTDTDDWSIASIGLGAVILGANDGDSIGGIIE